MDTRQPLRRMSWISTCWQGGISTVVRNAREYPMWSNFYTVEQGACLCLRDARRIKKAGHNAPVQLRECAEPREGYPPGCCLWFRVQGRGRGRQQAAGTTAGRLSLSLTALVRQEHKTGCRLLLCTEHYGLQNLNAGPSLASHVEHLQRRLSDVTRAAPGHQAVWPSDSQPVPFPPSHMAQKTKSTSGPQTALLSHRPTSSWGRSTWRVRDPTLAVIIYQLWEYDCFFLSSVVFFSLEIFFYVHFLHFSTDSFYVVLLLPWKWFRI